MWLHTLKTFFSLKIYFKWREPKAIVQMRNAEMDANLKWWTQPLVVVVTIPLVLLLWYLHRVVPGHQQSSFAAALFRGVAGGISFAYVVPWINKLCPSEVRLFYGYLYRTQGNTKSQVTYASMEYFAWREAAESAMLVVKQRKRNREIFFGVPREMSKDAIQAFLVSRGVTLKQTET